MVQCYTEHRDTPNPSSIPCCPMKADQRDEIKKRAGSRVTAVMHWQSLLLPVGDQRDVVE